MCVEYDIFIVEATLILHCVVQCNLFDNIMNTVTVKYMLSFLYYLNCVLSALASWTLTVHLCSETNLYLGESTKCKLLANCKNDTMFFF